MVSPTQINSLFYILLVSLSHNDDGCEYDWNVLVIINM